jgi:hypothetical protein
MMQPFGPDEQIVFTTPGSHYRGFPAIGVCDSCKQNIQAGRGATFRYRGQVTEILPRYEREPGQIAEAKR